MPRRIVDTPTGRSIVLTDHAMQRAASMGVSPMEIARAAWQPDVCYRGSEGEGQVQRCDDSDIAIVLIPDEGLVVTVLEQRYDDYVRPD